MLRKESMNILKSESNLKLNEHKTMTTGNKLNGEYLVSEMKNIVKIRVNNYINYDRAEFGVFNFNKLLLILSIITIIDNIAILSIGNKLHFLILAIAFLINLIIFVMMISSIGHRALIHDTTCIFSGSYYDIVKDAFEYLFFKRFAEVLTGVKRQVYYFMKYINTDKSVSKIEMHRDNNSITFYSDKESNNIKVKEIIVSKDLEDVLEVDIKSDGVTIKMPETLGHLMGIGFERLY